MEVTKKKGEHFKLDVLFQRQYNTEYLFLGLFKKRPQTITFVPFQGMCYKLGILRDLVMIARHSCFPNGIIETHCSHIPGICSFCLYGKFHVRR